MQSSGFPYRPFTWVPPEVEKHFDKKGKEVIKIKKAGYLKLTHESGTVIEDSKGVRYRVEKTGALTRVSPKEYMARKWERHNRGQTLTQKKG